MDKVSAQIEMARKVRKDLIRHYDGKNIQGYLERINEYENENQFKLRKKSAVSNESLMCRLLRPLDNVWNSKGSSENYIFVKGKQEELKTDFLNKLQSVRGNYSLMSYIKDVWMHELFTDPNGLLFMEISADGKTMYPTIKTSNSIVDYQIEGNIIKWVAFEPHKKDSEGNSYAWIVDEKKSIEIKYKYIEKEVQTKQPCAVVGYAQDNIINIYKNIFSGYDIVQELPNKLGFVPAMCHSFIEDHINGLKLSPISKQIELFDSYLLDNSVLKAYQFKHGFPVSWGYVAECSFCNGTGQTGENEVCSVCGGTGKDTKKDVSDMITLKVPTTREQPFLGKDVMGYIQPDLQTWTKMEQSLDRTFNQIHESQWGSTVSFGGKDRETATGRFIDVQPVNNRLNEYADMIEHAVNFIINCLGKFYYGNDFISGVRKIGRIFILESPDAALDRYKKAKESKLSCSILDYLAKQYYMAEYIHDDLECSYRCKLLELEPFVHYSIDEVKTFGVSDEEYKRKLYFHEWLSEIEKKSIIVEQKAKLLNSFSIYLNSKSIKLKSNKDEQKD